MQTVHKEYKDLQVQTVHKEYKGLQVQTVHNGQLEQMVLPLQSNPWQLEAALIPRMT